MEKNIVIVNGHKGFLTQIGNITTYSGQNPLSTTPLSTEGCFFDG